MTVLLVEDAPGIRHLVRDQLQDLGVQVTVTASLAAARKAVGRASFTAVVIELVLPDGSGLDLLEELRQSGSRTHVIILSERTAEDDHVLAFQQGADDYVVKPFYLRELTARILAASRRCNPAAGTRLRLSRLTIDLESRAVSAAGTALDLTPKEFDLLAFLAARPGRVFSRDQLLEAVWQSDSGWQQAATVTEHIRRLRAKVEVDPSHPALIRTVRGTGYRLDLPDTDDLPGAGSE